MPKIPPTKFPIIELNEKKSAPHKRGIDPPIIEHNDIEIRTIDFEDIDNAK